MEITTSVGVMVLILMVVGFAAVIVKKISLVTMFFVNAILMLAMALLHNHILSEKINVTIYVVAAIFQVTGLYIRRLK